MKVASPDFRRFKKADVWQDFAGDKDVWVLGGKNFTAGKEFEIESYVTDVR